MIVVKQDEVLTWHLTTKTSFGRKATDFFTFSNSSPRSLLIFQLKESEKQTFKLLFTLSLLKTWLLKYELNGFLPRCTVPVLWKLIIQGKNTWEAILYFRFAQFWVLVPTILGGVFTVYPLLITDYLPVFCPNVSLSSRLLNRSILGLILYLESRAFKPGWR